MRMPKPETAKRAGEIVKMLRIRYSAVGAARRRRAARDTSRSATMRKRCRCLRRAADDHDSFFSSESLAENFFDPIRGDTRFAAIVAKGGIG